MSEVTDGDSAKDSVRFSIRYKSRAGLTRGLYRRGGKGFFPRKDDVEEAFIRTLLPKLDGKIVWDIGGYHGLHTIAYASVARHVYVFEPNPKSREIIQGNVEANGYANVTIIPFALSDQSGKGVLRFPRNAPAWGSLLPTAGGDSEEIVEIKTADEMLAVIEPPAYIKIDTEGLEASVLRGARKILAEFRPMVFAEIHGADSEEKERNAAEVLNLLSDFYCMHAEDHSVATKENCAAGHIFAVPGRRDHDGAWAAPGSL